MTTVPGTEAATSRAACEYDAERALSRVLRPKLGVSSSVVRISSRGGGVMRRILGRWAVMLGWVMMRVRFWVYPSSGTP